MKKEGLEYATMLAIVCLAIVGAVVIMTSLASADDSQVELPEPEYISADTMVLSRAEAPARNGSGLATYETFGEALERAKADVPDELAELAGRTIWGEAGGIPDEAQRAAVVWCACNRADAWGMDIGDVLNVDQFHGLAIKGEVPPSMLNWHGMCWRGGRWRLRAGKVWEGCCPRGFCTLRATGALIITARSLEAENIGGKYCLQHGLHGVHADAAG